MFSVEPSKKASKLELKFRKDLEQARKREKVYWSLWKIKKANEQTDIIHDLLKKIRRLERLTK